MQFLADPSDVYRYSPTPEGYLVYLGIRQWRSAPLSLDAQVASAHQPHTPGRLFLQGMGVAVTNPKAILFFTALFPQFLTPGGSLLWQTVLLTVTFTTLALVSHAFYVGLFRTLKRFLTEARHMRLFNRISGGLFVLFVPNIAESFSKGLAGAVYGIILLLVIYLMPSGAAGLVRLITAKLARQAR